MHPENSLLRCLFKNNTHRQFLFAFRLGSLSQLAHRCIPLLFLLLIKALSISVKNSLYVWPWVHWKLMLIYSFSLSLIDVFIAWFLFSQSFQSLFSVTASYIKLSNAYLGLHIPDHLDESFVYYVISLKTTLICSCVLWGEGSIWVPCTLTLSLKVDTSWLFAQCSLSITGLLRSL